MIINRYHTRCSRSTYVPRVDAGAFSDVNLVTELGDLVLGTT